LRIYALGAIIASSVILCENASDSNLIILPGEGIKEGADRAAATRGEPDTSGLFVFFQGICAYISP
jgi:hypothetical protein